MLKHAYGSSTEGIHLRTLSDVLVMSLIDVYIKTKMKKIATSVFHSCQYVCSFSCLEKKVVYSVLCRIIELLSAI